MKKKIHSVLVLSLLFVILGSASVKAQGGTYCDQYFRFCMATSYAAGDSQSSSNAFYVNVSSGIHYSASFEAWTSWHAGYVWIQYGSGTFALESYNEGSKYSNGVLSTSGIQWIDIFAQASGGKSYVSVSW